MMSASYTIQMCVPGVKNEEEEEVAIAGPYTQSYSTHSHTKIPLIRHSPRNTKRTKKPRYPGFWEQVKKKRGRRRRGGSSSLRGQEGRTGQSSSQRQLYPVTLITTAPVRAIVPWMKEVAGAGNTLRLLGPGCRLSCRLRENSS